ncbi:MAG: hypothetical protein IPN03_18190 [Holophagales bacterium]|nr:hypothetical protein [Holophagales bacterium]
MRRKLTGEKRGSFALEGSNWFRRPEGEPDEAAWKADLALLAAEHGALVAAVARTLPGSRAQPVRRRSTSCGAWRRTTSTTAGRCRS